MQDNNNINKIKIQVVKSKKIGKEKYVKAIVQGKYYIDIIDTEYPAGATVRKLSKDKYIVLSTGEVRNYEPKKTTEKAKEDLRKTFTRLRQLIRTNFTAGSKNQLFITLTYRENMTDEKRLYEDFKNFMKKLKRKFKEHKFEYITVAEPQERGAWHFHIMLKSTNQKNLYIDNKTLSELWGQGYTDTQRLKSDDVGSYYVAYFTDLLEEDANGNKKRKKGSRLSMYPKGFKFYRCSRGIEKPKVINIQYGELMKQGYKNTYTIAFEIYDMLKERVINIIQKETWKREIKEKDRKPSTFEKQIAKNIFGISGYTKSIL